MKRHLTSFFYDDHVRNYGKDYVDRLKESGFTVTVVKVSDLVDMEEADRMALTNQRRFHLIRFVECGNIVDIKDAQDQPNNSQLEERGIGGSNCL